VLCAAVAFACQSHAPGLPTQAPSIKPEAPEVQSRPPVNVDDVADEVALLLAGRAPTSEERALGSKLSLTDSAANEQYVDALLATDAFVKEVGPRLVLGRRLLQISGFVLPRNWVLLNDKQGNETVYYLRWAQKCSAKDAVRVTPWWTPDKPVLICPTSYRPAMFESARTKHHCDAIGPVSDSETDCGCGPNLVRCLPDFAMWEKVEAAMAAESKATVAHLLAERAPIQSIYTTNPTARTRYAELIYRRWLVEDQKLKAIPGLDELQTWSTDAPRWVERPEAVPGQHAGILTDPNTAFCVTGLRALMRTLIDTMWCTGEDSSNVETSVVLSLGREIRGADGTSAGAGWQLLASREVCTNCHARMDYASRAWLGFPDVRFATHFISHQQLSGTGKDVMGPLYSDNIDDQRGEMPLNPLGFAKQVMAQPEFSACMTKKVVGHVFADSGTPEDTQAIGGQFASTGRLQDMLRVAALRFIQRKLAAADRHGDVASTNLQTLVTSRCQDCHDFYKSGEPDRNHLQSMLEMVYLERMPKKGGLPRTERNAMIHALSVKLDRPASAFLEDGYRGLAVHRPDLMSKVIASSVAANEPGEKGASNPNKQRQIENVIDPARLEYTPSTAMEVSLAAVKACEKREGPNATAQTISACAREVVRKRSAIRPTTEH
jgi:hypothetical protein